MKRSKKFTDDFSFTQEEESNFGSGEYHHPDALSADEILKNDKSDISSGSALDSLLKRVTNVAQNTDDSQSIKAQQETIELKSDNPEILNEDKTITESISEKNESSFEGEQQKPQKSLFDKCMPYILDDNGNDSYELQQPLYKLETVAEILKSESERTLEKLSKEYGISFEGATVIDESNLVKEDEQPSTIEEPPLQESVSVEKSNEEAEDESQPINEEKTEEPYRLISDIDIPDSPFYELDTSESATQETVTFTPVANHTSDGPSVIVNTNTRQLGFTGELLKLNETAPAEKEEVQLEKSEIEEYQPDCEYTDVQSGRALLKKLARVKKNSILIMWGTIFLTLLIGFFELPFISNLILSQTKLCMGITLGFMLMAVGLNVRMFKGIVKMFSRTANADVSCSLAVIAVVLYSVFGFIQGQIILNMQLLLMLILSFYSIGRFMKDSAMLTSFKQILNNSPKHAVELINDPTITFAMTRGSIDGEVMISAPHPTEQVSDFMKYATFGVFLDGKVRIIAAVSLLLSVLTGFLSAAYFDSVVSAFYAASAILCMAAMPCLMLIDALPFYNSAKKLSRFGAMIAGKTGAAFVEESNAVVVNACDIFPSSTVTLHRMQILNENNLEDTIIRAASLTEALQSPLAPIFKRIAGTSNITTFPDSDTVKYEEAMGISGWVDNRLLFIGNRTLMEAHGITVPDVELDRKILRQGYFPVYVASQNKACALLVVNYDVDEYVAKEIRRLTGDGVTLLVKTSDPNLTQEMICDYFGLYDDTVKVMTAAGCHIYVNSVTPVKSVSAPAAYKSNPLGLPAILNCASRMRSSNIILTVAYIIIAVFGVLLFTYSSFGGSGSLLSDTALLLYTISSTIVSYLIYLIRKP